MRRTLSPGGFWVITVASLVGVGALVGGGCTLTTNLDGLSGGAASPDGSFVFPGGGDGGRTEASTGDAQPQVCVAGGQLAPVAVTTLPDDVLAGSWCNVESALVVDGTFAGLDRPHGSDQDNIDGTVVTACVVLDFGSEQAPLSLTVTARASSNACAASPCVTGTGCGTGRSAYVFTAPATKKWNSLDSYPVGETAVGHVSPTDGLFVRYVMVCRGASGQERDDVEVDGVTLGCR